MTRRRPHVLRLASCAVIAALCTSTLAGCSGDDAAPAEATSEEPDTSSATRQPEPVETTASIDRVDGRLARDGRDQLQERVTAAVDTWIDAAYAGDYPRTDFSGAFATFTDAARRRALADEDLLTNAAVGSSLDAVLPVRRRLSLDVLGVEGTAVAVTARVDLALELTGEVTRTDRVSGSLYLTYSRSSAAAGGSPGWRVFGYDLRRQEA